MSFTRSQSIGVSVTSLTSSNTLISYSPDFPRFNSSNSFFIEPKSKNYVKNSNFVGGSNGSPGTLPSGVSVNSISGLTRTLTYSSDGTRTFVNFTYSGNASSLSNLEITLNSSRTRSIPGTVWTFSAHTVSSTPIRVVFDFLSPNGSVLSSSPELLLQQSGSVSATHTNISATAVLVRLLISVPISTSSLEFSIAAPQLEMGTSSTTRILSSDIFEDAERFSENYEIESDVLSQNKRIGTVFGSIEANTIAVETIPKSLLNLGGSDGTRLTLYRNPVTANLFVGTFNSNNSYSEIQVPVTVSSNTFYYGISWHPKDVIISTDSSEFRLGSNPISNVWSVSIGDLDSYLPVVLDGVLNPAFSVSRTSDALVWYQSNDGNFYPTTQQMPLQSVRGLYSAQEWKNFIPNPFGVGVSQNTAPTGWSRTSRIETTSDSFGMRLNTGGSTVISHTITGNTGTSPVSDILEFCPRTTPINSGNITGSFYYRLANTVSGNTASLVANSTFSMRFVSQFANGSVAQSLVRSIAAPTTNWQFASTTWNSIPPTNTSASLGVGITNIPPNANNINLPLEYMFPMLQRNSFATPPVTPATRTIYSATKGADLISSSLSNLKMENVVGTYLFSFFVPEGLGADSIDRPLFYLDSSSSANRFSVFNPAGTQQLIVRKTVSGVNQSLTYNISNGSVVRGAISIFPDMSVRCSINGLTTQSISSGNFANPLLSFVLSGSFGQLNGFINYIIFLPRTFGDTILQRMSTENFYPSLDNPQRGRYKALFSRDQYTSSKRMKDYLNILINRS